MDELPSLSPGLQAKVLTAIEDRKIRRVGGQKMIEVDTRLIAATNQNLQQLVADGKFREDLYHRLDLFRIHLPPLRTRSGDILKLAELLLIQLSRRHRLPPKVVSEAGRRRLLAYPWPGNVRELAHELERALVFEESNELAFEQLKTQAGAESATSPNLDDWFNENYVFPDEGFALEEAINRLIRQALKQSGNNVSGAARLLGVSRDFVRYRLAGHKTPDTPGD